MISLQHVIIQNNPARETISAGLGPIEQYSIALAVFILVVIVYYIKKRKKK